MRDINFVIAELISSGLAIDQNKPTRKNIHGVDEIAISGATDLSVTLKSVAYVDAYNATRDNRSYNVKMIDGGLLQFLFRYKNGVLLKNRLAFFPSPDLIDYQNGSEYYDNDELYGDIVDKGVVTSPIRFDFDPKNAVDLEHPLSHCTIGQYKNCRIPVSGPMTPSVFAAFILRSFYNTPFKNFLTDFRVSSSRFNASITDLERSVLYLGVHG